MSVTFNTPVRVFKRNNPTNDGTIAPDNTGAAIVSQQAAIVGGTATQIRIPAGSIIHSITDYVTTAAGTPGATDVTLGTDVLGTLTDAAGVNTASLTGTAFLANTGTSDLWLSYTAGASAVGVLSVQYTARNPDGTITAQGAGLYNS
ncbi:hypothetical protein UFOVP229_57 [uncultured Caudovirales phage]|uniref:Uncharacterized protein n=1 Tax=uncultured Caudovirales phage TaxID=2100421 RepID=A0A6J7WRG7_9CAUD|nr:hypothetical protein UFOVP229_57 [uncultured Caudovirales phage]